MLSCRVGRTVGHMLRRVGRTVGHMSRRVGRTPCREVVLLDVASMRRVPSGGTSHSDPVTVQRSDFNGPTTI